MSTKKKFKKVDQEHKDSDSDEEGSRKKTDQDSVTIVPTTEEINKIGFVYLFRQIETLDFDIEKVKEMPTLLNNLSNQIKSDFHDVKSMFGSDGELLYEPYNLIIINAKGKLTPVQSMEQIFEIVRSFPVRKKVYFNIKPYFEVMSQIKKSGRKEKAIESKVVVSELRVRGGDKAGFDSESSVLSEQNFLETLDELSRSRIEMVKEMCPDKKTDKEIYMMLKECDGDVDTVIDQLLDC